MNGEPPPFVVATLNAYIQRLNLIFGPIGFETNIVLVHPPTGMSLSAGISGPDALLDAQLATRDAPDTFVGLATIEGEMIIDTGETKQ
jgi:hypothetical protein